MLSTIAIQGCIQPMSDIPDPEWWILAYCHPREEFRARDSLERNGFAVYLPTRQKLTRPRGSTKLVLAEVPRFERYLFVGMQEDMRWRRIMATPGVASLIASSTGVPSLLPLRLIEEIRAIIALEPKPDPKARPKWGEGDLLVVLSGIYAERRAVFDRWEGEQAAVFLQMFGRAVRMRIDPKLLDAI